MSKVVKIVALVAIAAAIVVFAAPIAGAIAGLGAGIASSAAIAAVTSAVVGVGLSIGLSAISSLFRKAPSLSNSLADRLSASINPTAPRKIVFGKTAAGNDLRFYEFSGSKKDRYAQVIALASHRLNAVNAFYTEEELTWSNGSLLLHRDGITSIRAVTEGKANNAFALGSGSYWNASSRFTGCAYLAIDWKFDSKAWPSGIPAKLTTLVEGCPVYDPRLDSTNGGTGSHRIADQSTWEYRHNGIEIGRNPSLCLLAYIIGWRINGKAMWGMGIPSNRINFDNFRTYANVCEERVLLKTGATTQRYYCDGIFSTADSHESVISAITAAMGSCKFTDVGGLYGMVGGYDDTLGPKQDFTANDLVGGTGAPSPYSWVPAGPSRETYNIARGKFADPSQQFQLADWGAIETDPLPDGIDRTLTLDFGCVSSAEQCQRIAKQFLMREAKTPGFFSATFGPRAFAVQVGSLVSLSLPAQGWNRKLFRVQEQKEVHDMLYQMTLREESSDVYAWDREEKSLPSTIRPPGYDERMTVAVQGLSATSTAYTGVGA